MPRIAPSIPYICAHCRAEARRSILHQKHYRTFTSTPHTPQSAPQPRPAQDDSSTTPRNSTSDSASKGAMSQRLTTMSEEALETGGKAAQKSIEDAGFDEELKQRLLNRIADSTFKSENASALAQANLPSSAGQGTRDIAAAKGWTGTESIADATLRMLDDAAPRPIRTPFRVPTPRGVPIKIETGRKPAVATGARLANARDKASSYSYLKDEGLSQEEREKFRKELKERFTSTGASRSLPATIKGLQSLANERIEDAIARGQFKNLPRGKKIERDHNMSSPFLDTTEYFMNKIIQRQDIVPPWIEKQQEVVSTANKFRGRLRNDWKRYASRMIAAQGGSLEAQIRRAEEYARVEAIVNPGQRKVESLNAVDGEGRVSQITLAGELRVPSTTEEEVKEGQETITVVETAPMPPSEALSSTPPAVTTTTTSPPPPSTSTTSAPPTDPTPTTTTTTETTSTESAPNSTSPDPSAPLIPFRSPTWVSNEHSYHTLAITSLNSLTRSYNLMAPKIAQKPYFHLDRELLACYRDVAPLLAEEIAVKARMVGKMPGADGLGREREKKGVLDRLVGEKVVVHEERVGREYGFRQFWRDLWVK